MNGFSFIEVIITIFIVSIGLLGLLTLQVVISRRNYEAYLYSIATIQISSMFNRSQVGYTKREEHIWKLNNMKLLPNGEGTYNGRQDILVCWFNRLIGKQACLTNDEIK